MKRNKQALNILVLFLVTNNFQLYSMQENQNLHLKHTAFVKSSEEITQNRTEELHKVAEALHKRKSLQHSGSEIPPITKNPPVSPDSNVPGIYLSGLTGLSEVSITSYTTPREDGVIPEGIRTFGGEHLETHGSFLDHAARESIINFKNEMAKDRENQDKQLMKNFAVMMEKSVKEKSPLFGKTCMLCGCLTFVVMLQLIGISLGIATIIRH